ncbi:antibiotic biosynthesis monooxygenase family protein [Luteimonas terrae]|uniref:Heme-degrading monooxygenase HmoA n=1 Tax=Luteimonas terrae TaxID=1530191 RepID=A0ABU1XZI3_9GAMM|nr:antibiotic biosynthesis monooxygenase [Luteimonas terrae]MDR7194179.1 heme-degrading monooxygenase HmoA [Luteimonas terrae]
MSRPVLPRPPYHVAILRYRRNGEDAAGYSDSRRDMLEMATLQPGFLGMESVEDVGGEGVTLSYWADEASIRAWRAHNAQGMAREKSQRAWYDQYALQVARVERAYDWSRDEADDADAREAVLPA